MDGRKHLLALAAGLLLLGSFPAVLHATPPAPVAPPQEPTDETGQPQPENGGGSFLSQLSRSGYLFGNWWGVRPLISRYGISIYVTETSEVLGNVTGGVKRSAEYDGLTQMDLQLDTQRAFNLYGGLFNASAFQIHGRNLSAENLYTLQTASGIEADRSTRLWELWYQQKFFDEDRVDVKIGQQSLDQEFMVTQNGGFFVNTMFGWPVLPSYDLPGGGPAYPLSAPGVRVRARPADSLTFLVGAFNGSPVEHNVGDPQQQNPSGTTFPLDGGVLAIAEAQYAYPALGSMVYAGQSEPLAGVYKIGGWYDSENFPDQLRDRSGLSLASPTSSGIPLSHHGDFGFYAVVDQMIWRDAADSDRTLSFFTRLMGTPEEDRNLIDFGMNAGFVLRDPLPHRDDDIFGVGMGYAKVSNRASALDREIGTTNRSYYPIRSGETYLEVTYQYQVTPWCELQPDFQYVFNPGGGVLNPNSPGHTIGNELVLGLRVNISF